MNKGTNRHKTYHALQWSILLACSLIGITVFAVSITYTRSTASAPDFSASGKSVDHTLFAPGDLITYTLYVSNSGTAKAFSASMLDPLPPGMQLNPNHLQATIGQVTSAGTLVSWTSALLPGMGAVITIPVTVNTCDWPLTNTATVADPTALDSTAISAFAQEGFEGVSGVFTSTFPTTGWEVDIVTGATAAWSRETSGINPSAIPYHDTAMAQFNAYGALSGDAARLQTRSLHFPAGYAPQLSFWMYHDSGVPALNDRLQVQVSTDGGASFHDIAGASFSRFSDQEGWSQHVVSLTAYIGQSNVRIGFLGISGFGYNMYIDDVGIQYVPQAANFIYQPPQPRINQPTSFKDATPGIASQSTRMWDFGDGTPVQQGEMVTYTYGSIGTYTVTMTMCDSIVSHTIYASANPEGIDVAVASSSPTPLMTPTFFTPTASSASWPITLTWDFGDHSPIRTGALISHTYITPGVYTATLSATNATGSIRVTTLVTVLPAADLSVSQRASPLPAGVAKILTYTLTFTNHGPLDDTGVLLTDTLPAGAHMTVKSIQAVGSSQSACGQSANVITCNLGALANGHVATVTLLVQPGSSVTATNHVEVTGAIYDPDLANNSADTTIFIEPVRLFLPAMTIPPLSAPVLNPIMSPSINGNYEVTWGTISRAVTYTLQEGSGLAFANPRTVYSGAGLSWSAVDKPAGTYSYRVQASNASDTSPWSNLQTVTVTLPYDGYWSGTTSQNRSVGFNVTQYEITWLALNFNVAGCEYVSQQYFSTPAVITGNKFTLSRNEATFSYVLTGTFSSTSVASGGISIMAWDTTSTPPCVGTATATWTATRK